MPEFSVGERVRVRADHGNCHWCAAARGARGRVRNVTGSSERTVYHVFVELRSEASPVLLPFKRECLEAAQ